MKVKSYWLCSMFIDYLHYSASHYALEHQSTTVISITLLKLILIQIHSYNLNLSLHLESLERSHQDVGLAIRSHVFCVNSCSPLWAIQHGGDR